MDALFEISWRAYPAGILVALGLGLAGAAVRRWRFAASLDRDPERALAYALGFRTGILGLCTAAFGLGWFFAVEWVLVVSLIVLGEEMLEIGVMIAALRAAPRVAVAPRGASPLPL
jgi:hypothetical protein